MILLVAALAALAIVLLRGGKLHRLAGVNIRTSWLILAAFALQLYLVYVPAGRSRGFLDPGAWLHLGSYLLLLAAVWQNRNLPGIKLIGIGLLLNLAVIVANGGFMPIEPETVVRIGHGSRVMDLQAGYRVHQAKDVVLPRELTRLWPLSDIFVLAAPFPMPTAFSLGDVFLSVGVFVLLQRVMVVPAKEIEQPCL